MANHENSVLSARAQAAAFKDRLKNLLNMAPWGLDPVKTLISLDSPGLDKAELSFKDLLRIAYAVGVSLKKKGLQFREIPLWGAESFRARPQRNPRADHKECGDFC